MNTRCRCLLGGLALAQLSSCRTRSFGQGAAPHTIAGDKGLVTGSFEARVRVRGQEVRFLATGDRESRTRHAQRFARLQFRYIHRVFDAVLFDAEPEISALEVRPDGSEAEIRYRYVFKIAPEEASYVDKVKEVQVFMPPFADKTGLRDFFTHHVENCHMSDTPDDFAASEGAFERFFFFFDAYACTRDMKAGVEAGVVETAMVKTAPWTAQGEARQRLPEYGKIWEDGKLSAVVLVASTGVSEEGGGGLEPGDAGETAFNMIYHKVKRRYPQARIEFRGANPQQETRLSPAPANWFVHFVDEQTSGRAHDITLLYVPEKKLTKISPASPIPGLFRDLARNSDLIVFSGHADLGENVEALSHWGDFVPNHHYTLYVNSCWSAGYFFSPEVMENPTGMVARIQALNAGQPWSRWLDLVMNADESNMFKMASNTMSLIEAFDSRSATLFDVVNRLSQDARPIIMGDEDNPIRPQ